MGRVCISIYNVARRRSGYKCFRPVSYIQLPYSRHWPFKTGTLINTRNEVKGPNTVLVYTVMLQKRRLEWPNAITVKL